MAEVPNIKKLVHLFANQWSGFFMLETSVMKELNQHVFY